MALLVLSSVTSTMDVAREMLVGGQVVQSPDGVIEPCGVLALHQTAGRGQRGRVWHSSPGESLCATYFIALTPQDKTAPGRLGIMAGVAVLDALSDAMGSTSQNPLPGDFGLKWPNDILLEGRKLGGVLIEVCTAADRNLYAMVGVGVNVRNRHFPAELNQLSTSLSMYGCGDLQLHGLAETVGRSILSLHQTLNQDGFGQILSMWRQHDQTSRREVYMDTPRGRQRVTATGVDDEGALLVTAEDGVEHRIASSSLLLPGPVG